MTRAIVSAACAVLFTTSASASTCLDEAVQDKKACKADCREAFQTAKDACLNRDHACVEVCRAERSECRDATGIDAALLACESTLEDARAQCRATTAPGTPERDQCVDQAQVVAFQCRDTARENARPALKECRATFKTCARACPPAGPSGPENPKQCKADAKDAYHTCKGDCREDYQIAKDLCRNRDHECAEDCRAERWTCKEPILTQLEDDKAQCNDERDDDIDVCEGLYGTGTPELDQCTDNAQVDAFQCRDGHREAAKPGLNACRSAYQTCVQACPPPS